jgi:hypothetical protein
MQPPEGVQVDLGKAQVIDRVPKIIKELKFGVLYECPCSASRDLVRDDWSVTNSGFGVTDPTTT